MSAIATPFDVESLIAGGSLRRLASLLAPDVTWVEVDQRAPAVYRGRAAVRTMLGDLAARGVASEVLDGICTGDRAALALLYSYPGGEARANALLHLRDGLIVRWDGVQVWDE